MKIMKTPQSGKMENDDFDSIEKKKTEIIFNSRLGFLKATNGLRPGELHTLLAPAGSGKSTLIKTIVSECILNRVKVYTQLSEEPVDLYKHGIAKTFYKISKNRTTADEFLTFSTYDSLLTWHVDLLNVNDFFEYIQLRITNYSPKVFIFDNYTTSFLSSLTPEKQESVIMRFKKLADQTGVALIIVCHTAKGVANTGKILSGEDVRGNSSLTNVGSYNYVLQSFFDTSSVRSFLIIDKARYHSAAQKTAWELEFDTESEIFIGDQKTDRKSIQAFINLQKEEIKDLEKKLKDKKTGKKNKDWQAW